MPIQCEICGNENNMNLTTEGRCKYEFCPHKIGHSHFICESCKRKPVIVVNKNYKNNLKKNESCKRKPVKKNGGGQ